MLKKTNKQTKIYFCIRNEMNHTCHKRSLVFNREAKQKVFVLHRITWL